MAIADCCLCHLRDQRLGVAQQQAQERAGPPKLIFQQLGPQAIPVPGALHDRAAGGGLTAHEQGDAEDPLITDDRNFCRRTVFHNVEQRNDGGRRKIHIAQLDARLVEDIAEFQRHELQMRGDPLVILCGEGIEEMVLAWAVARQAHLRGSVREGQDRSLLFDVCPPASCHGSLYIYRVRQCTEPHTGGYFFLSASFNPPIVLCSFPLARSPRPSAVSLASPSTLPANSLTTPLACVLEPLTRSLSMLLPYCELLCCGVQSHWSMRRAWRLSAAVHRP